MGGIFIKSKIIFALLVTFVLTSLTCVSATDSNHGALEDYQGNGEVGNFTDLNVEIGKITTGGNLTLEKDYTYNNDSD